MPIPASPRLIAVRHIKAFKHTNPSRNLHHNKQQLSGIFFIQLAKTTTRRGQEKKDGRKEPTKTQYTRLLEANMGIK